MELAAETNRLLRAALPPAMVKRLFVAAALLPTVTEALVTTPPELTVTTLAVAAPFTPTTIVRALASHLPPAKMLTELLLLTEPTFAAPAVDKVPLVITIE